MRDKYNHVCQYCGNPLNDPNHLQRKFCNRICMGASWQSTPESFWKHVNRLEDLDACWIWTARTIKRGYGRMNWHNRHTLAHRISYELAYGPISPDVLVLHSCDNPPCCNPRHLFTGTNADNVADMISKGRGVHLAGEMHPNARFTQAEVDSIRSRAHGYGSQIRLAHEYGVNKGTIWNIVHFRNYRH